MTKLENLKLDELKLLLKQVVEYKTLRKQLWNRWIELFNKKMNWTDSFVVEYFSDTELAFNIAKEVYKKAFNFDIKQNEIKFIKKEELKWWIKVYKNDSMVDISFSKIEKLIR